MLLLHEIVNTNKPDNTMLPGWLLGRGAVLQVHVEDRSLTSGTGIAHAAPKGPNFVGKGANHLHHRALRFSSFAPVSQTGSTPVPHRTVPTSTVNTAVRHCLPMEARASARREDSGHRTNRDTLATNTAGAFKRRSPAFCKAGLLSIGAFPRVRFWVRAADYSPGVLEMAPPASLD